jgi:hypothetical protein
MIPRMQNYLRSHSEFESHLIYQGQKHTYGVKCKEIG